jgi:hypothetical protein
MPLHVVTDRDEVGRLLDRRLQLESASRAESGRIRA